MFNSLIFNMMDDKNSFYCCLWGTRLYIIFRVYLSSLMTLELLFCVFVYHGFIVFKFILTIAVQEVWLKQHHCKLAEFSKSQIGSSWGI